MKPSTRSKALLCSLPWLVLISGGTDFASGPMLDAKGVAHAAARLVRGAS